MTSRQSCGVSFGYSSACSCPWWRIMGGAPEVRCRSEASRSMTWSRTSAKSKSIKSPWGTGGKPSYRQRLRSRDSCDLADGRNAVLDLLEAVEPQGPHALLHGDLLDLVGGGSLDRERADLLTQLHDLVDA